MVPTNKILTVAYGTFSCTLEGFNDPFSTMTDIAEYFRDLAADDRFFGAEPPTPDMAMLRTIAEARANHAVKARPEEGGIVLSPAVAAEFPAGTTEAPVAAQEEVPIHDDTPAEPDVSAAEDEAVASDVDATIEPVAEAKDDEPVEEQEDEAQEDSVAAKLARIRGVVEADRQSDSIYAEDQHFDDMTADDTLVAAFAADALDDYDIDTDEVDEAAHVAVEDQSAKDELKDRTEVPDFTDATPEIAPEEAATLELPEEDTETAENTALFGEDTLTADLAAIMSTSDEAERDEAQEDDVTDTVEEPEFVAEADMSAVTTDTHVKDETAADEAVEMPSERIARRIRVRKIRRQTTEAAVATSIADHEVLANETTDEVTIDETLTDVEPNAIPDADHIEDDDLMAELSAIKAELNHNTAITTATDGYDDADDGDDLMAELAAIRAENDTFEDDTDEDEEDFVNAILSDDTDAGDLNEDEDVIANTETTWDDVGENEVEVDDDDMVKADGVETAETSDDEDPSVGPSAPDMERLFAATDSRLSGEDTSRRHANISHLKAAVAARRADGPVAPPEEAQTDAYRADLASSVRPRRPSSSTDGRPATTPRPERPAPLILVSEQRVEDYPAAASTPIQPRRVPRTAEIDVRDEALAGSQDFEAFASDVGADGLADILEAAAVYSTKVMGKDSFSRPSLMHLAAEAVDDMSREDGLRGFGMLLRNGTIRKISRGTFALASESRYAEEADRRAG